MKANYTEASLPLNKQKDGVYYETNIKHRRIMEKKTQKEIAAFLGITPQQYNLYEQGKRELPLRLLVALSVYYGIGIDELIMVPERKNLNSSNQITHTNALLKEADRELSAFEKNVLQNLTTVSCPVCRAPIFGFLQGAEGLYEITCPECKKKYHLILEAMKVEI